MTAPSPKVEQRLLPCPVCAQQPKWRGSSTDYRAGIYRLQCIGETHLFQAYGPSEDQCISNWNTRDLLTPSGDAEGRAREAAEKLKLWFFRDLSEGQRLSLIGLFLGAGIANEAMTQGHQVHCLRAIVAALTPPPAPTEAAGLREALERQRELKLCPVCRGPAQWHRPTINRVGVRCADLHGGTQQRLCFDDDEALSLWNTRAALAELPSAAILTGEEWAVVSAIGAEQELSDSAVIRQSLRLYQRHHERLKAGETVHWSGDDQRARDFAGPLAKSPPAAVGELTDRVRRLVIAARVAAYSDDDLDSRELDEAVEAFAADIPWENGDG